MGGGHHHDHAPRGDEHGHGDAHHHGAHDHGDAPFAERAFGIGLAANAAYLAVEAGVGFAVGSLALLADAAHNLGDVAGLALAWAGAAAGRLAASERHTYGFKRASIVAALANALLLVAMAGALAWEAVQRFAAPPAVPGLTVALVAAAGIAVNGATAWLFHRGREHDVNRRGVYLHMLTDAAASAAVVVGGALAWASGAAWIDPALGIGIAALVLWSTWGLLRESAHLLVDGVPAHIALADVRATLAGLPGVAAVDDLHVWATGTRDVALTAHLVMPAARADDTFIAAATALLRARHGIGHVTLQATEAPLALGCARPAPH